MNVSDVTLKAGNNDKPDEIKLSRLTVLWMAFVYLFTGKFSKQIFIASTNFHVEITSNDRPKSTYSYWWCRSDNKHWVNSIVVQDGKKVSLYEDGVIIN